LFVIDAPTSFMNTPVSAEGISPAEFLATASLWDKVFNYSWMPLNLHRLVGNVTFGGFIAGLIAAYMFMGSKKEEERAYYDWMGFVGNMIGVGALCCSCRLWVICCPTNCATMTPQFVRT
jgi:cytochrome d ubiquinol oxidase subunit I